jgi:hypothetical protein
VLPTLDDSYDVIVEKKYKIHGGYQLYLLLMPASQILFVSLWRLAVCIFFIVSHRIVGFRTLPTVQPAPAPCTLPTPVTLAVDKRNLAHKLVLPTLDDSCDVIVEKKYKIHGGYQLFVVK